MEHNLLCTMDSGVSEGVYPVYPGLSANELWPIDLSHLNYQLHWPASHRFKTENR